MEILSASLWVTYYDIDSELTLEDNYPEQPFWMIRKEGLPENVRVNAAWEDEKIIIADKIDSLSVKEWIYSAMKANQSPKPGLELCWKQIIFSTTKCRTFLPDNFFKGDEITVEEEGRIYQHPVERVNGETWITGPLESKSLSAPIRIIVDDMSGLFTMDISLYWSFWTDKDAPGTNKVNESIQQLLEKGWTIPSY